MKPTLSKKEQAERTRAKIIDAAIRLFAKRGFASTSTQDLAKAIGMTPGVLYWHFDGKEDLLIAVLAELQRRMLALLDQEAESAKGLAIGDTIQAMIARVADVVVRFQENLLLVGVIGAEATDSNPRVEKALREVYGQFAQVMRGLLERAAKEGLVDAGVDLDCAAEMFMGIYMGGILHQRLFRTEYPLHRALPVLQKMLFASVVPVEAARRIRGRDPEGA